MTLSNAPKSLFASLGVRGGTVALVSAIFVGVRGALRGLEDSGQVPPGASDAWNALPDALAGVIGAIGGIAAIAGRIRATQKIGLLALLFLFGLGGVAVAATIVKIPSAGVFDVGCKAGASSPDRLDAVSCALVTGPSATIVAGSCKAVLPGATVRLQATIPRASLPLTVRVATFSGAGCTGTRSDELSADEASFQLGGPAQPTLES